MAKRTTSAGASVEYTETNKIRTTDIGENVEYVETNNRRIITAIGVMVEFSGIPVNFHRLSTIGVMVEYVPGAPEGRRWGPALQ